MHLARPQPRLAFPTALPVAPLPGAPTTVAWRATLQDASLAHKRADDTEERVQALHAKHAESVKSAQRGASELQQARRRARPSRASMPARDPGAAPPDERRPP